MTRSCAPGKVILLGEHAVVYGRPALAVPVRQVWACARVEPAGDGPPAGLLLTAPDLGFEAWLDETPEDHPLAAAARSALEAIRPGRFPPLHLTIESDVPMASGLGSSAAVSVAVIRALGEHFGASMAASQVSDLAYQAEILQHGTPSGIDNTVVAHDRPVYFVRGSAPQPLTIGGRFELVIADTGEPAPTAEAVALVRRSHQNDPAALETVFDAIATLVEDGRQSIVNGDADRLGTCLSENHAHLVTLGVSAPSLDRLVEAALAAGARGAKLSGGGMGGNMLALARDGGGPALAEALRRAGAARVIRTEVSP